MTTNKNPSTGIRRSRLVLGLSLFACLLCGVISYSRYIDFPSFGSSGKVRTYLPEQYPVEDAYHYSYHNFMDNWELYRFSTTPEAIAFLASDLNLESQGLVHKFPMIISKPPPYWWDPELLENAELFSSRSRAPDGHNYNLLFSRETGIAYMVRFDG
jgi:hypothetical protein